MLGFELVTDSVVVQSCARFRFFFLLFNSIISLAFFRYTFVQYLFVDRYALAKIPISSLDDYCRLRL